MTTPREPVRDVHEPGHPVPERERRHRPDRPGPLPQDDRPLGPARGALRRLALRRRRRPRSPTSSSTGGRCRAAGSCSPATTSAPARRASTRRGRSWRGASASILSTSFADIFRNNALKNGLLPIVVEPDRHRQLFELVAEDPDVELTVDLEAQRIHLPGDEDLDVRDRPVREADDPRAAPTSWATCSRRLPEIDRWEARPRTPASTPRSGPRPTRRPLPEQPSQAPARPSAPILRA